MIRKRRVIASVVVVAVGAIAACLGPKLSSTEQEAVVCQSCTNGSNVYIMPDTPVGQQGSVDITIVPASGSSSSYDRIDAIAYSCPDFNVVAVLPGEVIRTCSGSGSMIPTAKAQPEVGDLVSCMDQAFTFKVTFDAQADGDAQCSLTLMGPSLTLPITVHAKGVAQPFAMDLSPNPMPFGDVRVGDMATQKLNIHNAGTQPLTVTNISISPMTGYLAVPNPGAIPAGMTAAVDVSCAPPTGNPTNFNSTLTVAAMNISPAQTISLTCRGITSALSISPSPVDVTTRVNESRTRTVTITNTGGANAVLGTLSIVPTVTGVPLTLVNPPNGMTIGSGGGSVSFDIKYDPTAPQAFTELAKVRIPHDTGMMREVQVNGAAKETVLLANPDVVDFGAVCAGTTVMKDVSVKAGAAGDFSLKSFSMPAAPFAFALKGPALPQTLMGNQGNSVNFTATVSPGVNQTDDVEATSILMTDIPGDTSHSLKFKAEVLPGGVGASPQTLDFGGVLKNTLSSAMSTEVRNCSEMPLQITSIEVTGTNKDDFSIVLPPANERLVTLAPHESVLYHIVMRAEKPGAKIATLVVTSATGDTKIGLLATALGGAGGDPNGESSYYPGWGSCCDGGGGNAGLWSIAVYLGLRRRRRK